MTYQAKNHDIRLNLINRVGSTEIASCINVTYQEKQLSKVVLSYTVQRLPTVVLEVEYTPAVEFVRVIPARGKLHRAYQIRVHYTPILGGVFIPKILA